MRSTLLSVVFYFSLLCAEAQTGYSPIQAGEKVPDYTFTNLINYPSNTARVSDFRGKLLILDFWNTGCAGCIASWPRLLELQRKFGESIQIILVNSFQDEVAVRKSFARRKRMAGVDMTLPTICGDSTLAKLFPHDAVPHIAWISKSGHLIQTTSGTQLSLENVEAIIHDRPVTLRLKINRADKIFPQLNKPLFVNGNGGNINEVKWQSILTVAKDSLYPVISIAADTLRGYYVSCYNQPVINLCRLAYSERYDKHGDLAVLPLSRMSWQVYNETKSTALTWDDSNRLYNYHLVTPPAELRELQRHMRADLKRYFGLEARWVKQPVKCLVFSAKDTSVISYKSGQRKFAIKHPLKLNKASMDEFIFALETATKYVRSDYPILDETGLKGLIGGIDVEVNLEDPEKLNAALARYGMSFTLQERMLDVLVITDAIK